MKEQGRKCAYAPVGREDCPYIMGTDDPHCCQHIAPNRVDMGIKGQKDMGMGTTSPPAPSAKTTRLKVKCTDVAELRKYLEANQLCPNILFVQVGALVISAMLTGEVTIPEKIVAKVHNMDIEVVPEHEI